MTYEIAIDGKNYRLELNQVDGPGRAVSMAGRSRSMPCWLGLM